MIKNNFKNKYSMRRSYVSAYEAGARLGTYRSTLDRIARIGKFKNQKGQLQKHSI